MGVRFPKLVPGGQFSADVENLKAATIESHDNIRGASGLLYGRVNLVKSLSGLDVVHDIPIPFWAEIMGTATPTGMLLGGVGIGTELLQLSASQPFPPGIINVMIDSEQLTVVSIPGQPGYYGIAARGVNGTTEASHDEGAAVAAAATGYLFWEQGGLAAGVLQGNIDGRGDPTGQILAYEVSGAEVPIGKIVQLWPGYDRQTYYLFKYEPVTEPIMAVLVDSQSITNPTTTLASSCGAGDLIISLNPYAAFWFPGPESVPFLAQLGTTGSGVEELVWVTAVTLGTPTVWTIERAVKNSPYGPTPHSAGDTVSVIVACATACPLAIAPGTTSIAFLSTDITPRYFPLKAPFVIRTQHSNVPMLVSGVSDVAGVVTWNIDNGIVSTVELYPNTYGNLPVSIADGEGIYLAGPPFAWYQALPNQSPGEPSQSAIPYPPAGAGNFPTSPLIGTQAANGAWPYAGTFSFGLGTGEWAAYETVLLTAQTADPTPGGLGTQHTFTRPDFRVGCAAPYFDYSPISAISGTTITAAGNWVAGQIVTVVDAVPASLNGQYTVTVGGSGSFQVSAIGTWTSGGFVGLVVPTHHYGPVQLLTFDAVAGFNVSPNYQAYAGYLGSDNELFVTINPAQRGAAGVVSTGNQYLGAGIKTADTFISESYFASLGYGPVLGEAFTQSVTISAQTYEAEFGIRTNGVWSAGYVIGGSTVYGITISTLGFMTVSCTGADFLGPVTATTQFNVGNASGVSGTGGGGDTFTGGICTALGSAGGPYLNGSF